MNPERKNLAVWISIGAVLVWVASFMPWGQMPMQAFATLNFPAGSIPSPLNNGFSNQTMMVSFNAWTGMLPVADFSIPDWIVPLLALAAAILAWAVVTDAWQAPPFLGPGLVVLGLLYVAATLVGLMAPGKQTFGIGIPTAIAGLAVMVYASFSLAMRPAAKAALFG
jgi:hypothetical protein